MNNDTDMRGYFLTMRQPLQIPASCFQLPQK